MKLIRKNRNTLAFISDIIRFWLKFKMKDKEVVMIPFKLHNTEMDVQPYILKLILVSEMCVFLQFYSFETID